MANQDLQTKTIMCVVKKTDPSVSVKATLSHPKSGGWSMMLDGTFIKGGNDPEDVNLGAGSNVVDKMLEVSAVMKNITGATAPMSLQVDVPGNSGSITGNIDPGHSVHWSLSVAFVELP